MDLGGVWTRTQKKHREADVRALVSVLVSVSRDRASDAPTTHRFRFHVRSVGRILGHLLGGKNVNRESLDNLLMASSEESAKDA